MEVRLADFYQNNATLRRRARSEVERSRVSFGRPLVLPDAVARSLYTQFYRHSINLHPDAPPIAAELPLRFVGREIHLSREELELTREFMRVFRSFLEQNPGIRLIRGKELAPSTLKRLESLLWNHEDKRLWKAASSLAQQGLSPYFNKRAWVVRATTELGEYDGHTHNCGGNALEALPSPSDASLRRKDGSFREHFTLHVPHPETMYSTEPSGIRAFAREAAGHAVAQGILGFKLEKKGTALVLRPVITESEAGRNRRLLKGELKPEKLLVRRVRIT
jgi:hypothetical protein